MYVTIKVVVSVMNEMNVELTYKEIEHVHQQYKVDLKVYRKYTSEIWKMVLEELIKDTIKKRPQLV